MYPCARRFMRRPADASAHAEEHEHELSPTVITAIAPSSP